MGCGETLFLSGEGYVCCEGLRCPRHTAPSEILADAETEHIVVLRERNFDVQHPLRERIGGELFDCELHQYLHSLDGPPASPGRYRAVKEHGSRWMFTKVAE